MLFKGGPTSPMRCMLESREKEAMVPEISRADNTEELHPSLF